MNMKYMLCLICAANIAPMHAMNKHKQQHLAGHLQHQIKQQQHKNTLSKELKQTKYACKFQKEIGQVFAPSLTLKKNDLAYNLMLLGLLATTVAQEYRTFASVNAPSSTTKQPICQYTKKEYTQQFADRLNYNAFMKCCLNHTLREFCTPPHIIIAASLIRGGSKSRTSLECPTIRTGVPGTNYYAASIWGPLKPDPTDLPAPKDNRKYKKFLQEIQQRYAEIPENA